MEVSTPSRSSANDRNADFTRPQDPESPSNLRAVKRTKQQSHLPPPILKIGGSASMKPDSAAAAVRSQFDEAERRAKVKREVYSSLATTIDKFVASYKHPDQRALALDVCSRFM